MDPNATLERIRELVDILMEEEDRGEDDPHGQALAGHVQTLDEWLSSGGFLPKEWTRRSA